MFVSTPLLAHDFWIQPVSFQAVRPGLLATMILVGHGEFRQRSPIAARRIVRLSTYDRRGAVDQRDNLSSSSAGEFGLTLRMPGRHVVVLATDRASTELPAARFNAYLAAEGLSLAQAYRARTGVTDSPGREQYARNAKALISVGSAPIDANLATRVYGMRLELVPSRDPALVGVGRPIAVRVLFEGAPLTNALVKLTDLADDAVPVAMARSDATGTVRLTVPRHGDWLLNVIWSIPTPRDRHADFETTFSSLAFHL